jgi:hypothetical protein
MSENNDFAKVSVKKETKQEISILAGFEGRKEYEIIRDAMRLYKAVLKKPSRMKNVEDIPVAEVISSR